MTTRDHCEACGWDGEDPVLQAMQGSGCGGVLWTLHACPACGEDVSQTGMLREGGKAIG
jgi:hypothetical protein